MGKEVEQISTAEIVCRGMGEGRWEGRAHHCSHPVVVFPRRTCVLGVTRDTSILSPTICPYSRAVELSSHVTIVLTKRRA
eukprot:2712418-Rhodomonas_salina.1